VWGCLACVEDMVVARHFCTSLSRGAFWWLCLWQCTLDSCRHRRVTGTGHNAAQADLMHVVCTVSGSAGVAHYTMLLVMCVPVLIVSSVQCHCGVGERLFDLLLMAFRMHDLELHPGTSMQTLAANANVSMGDLLFRYVRPVCWVRCLGCVRCMAATARVLACVAP